MLNQYSPITRAHVDCWEERYASRRRVRSASTDLRRLRMGLVKVRVRVRVKVNVNVRVRVSVSS